jgi:hypothetical protein
VDITKREKTLKELMVGKTWEYLHDNFHKFNQQNKIKIALAICTKDIPQEVTGMNQQIVVMNEIIKNSHPLRYNLGQTDLTSSSESPGQAISGN